MRQEADSFAELIQDELNVKSVACDANESALAHIQVKPDFRKLGPRFGAQMKAVAAAVAVLPAEQAAALAAGQAVTCTVAGAAVTLEAGDVTVQRTPREGLVVSAEGNVLVAIETTLTPELVAEGLAREFVSKVQNLRKEADFEVTQRIAIAFQADDAVAAAVMAHRDYVMAETLALSCQKTMFSVAGGETYEAVDLNGHTCHIQLKKA